MLILIGDRILLTNLDFQLRNAKITRFWNRVAKPRDKYMGWCGWNLWGCGGRWWVRRGCGCDWGLLVRNITSLRTTGV